MARIRHLSKAPITEAVVDFRVSHSPDFHPDQLRQARELLAPDYPKIEERKGLEALVALAGGQSPQALTRDLGFQGIWLKTEDEKSVAQFRVDGFTFNRLKPYTSWEHILPEALRLWTIYVELTRPHRLARVALRYINHMRLPGPGVELDDYIATGPRLPPSVPQVVASFATRVVLEYPEGRMNANVVQALEPAVDAPPHTLLLDIDVYRTEGLQVDDPRALREVLGKLRDYKNSIFFGSVHEKFVEMFE